MVAKNNLNQSYQGIFVVNYSGLQMLCHTMIAANNDPVYEYTDREKQLLNKCIRLIQGKPRDNKDHKSNDVTSPTDEMTDLSASMVSSVMTNSSIELCSPERTPLNGECAPFPSMPASPPGKTVFVENSKALVLIVIIYLGPRDPELVLYVPDMEEIRISPVVARKGYLNVLEHKTNGWKKRWVVSVFNVEFLTFVTISSIFGFVFHTFGTRSFNNLELLQLRCDL